MNRGLLESLPVQQLMMNLNPNWWNINTMMKPPPSPHQQEQQQQQPSSPLLPSLYPPPSSTPSLSPLIPPPPLVSSSWHHENQDHQLPESWSQLLLGGSVGEEDRSSGDGTDQLSSNYHQAAAVKQEVVLSESSPNYVFVLENQFNHQQAPSAAARTTNNWSHHQVMPPPTSSPISCVTTATSLSSNNNMLDFSNRKQSFNGSCRNHQQPILSSHECNSTATAAAATGGSLKKARVQPAACPTISTFKVRKEKLGDRITALHQLVSPFGKTDTASVLLEAIGYIRFLQNQIEALSSPYLGNGSGNMRHQQHSLVQGEKNSIFPEDPGQLLNDSSCMKRRGVPDQDPAEAEPKKDLRSRGLCLVPVSCTVQVGSDNGADYWAPALGGGFR